MPSGKRTHDVAALMDELETLNEKNVLKEQTYIGLADALKTLNEAQTRAPSEEDRELIARVEIPVNSFVREAPDMAALLNLLSNHQALQGNGNGNDGLRTMEINSLRITRRGRPRPNPANDQTNTPTAHSDASQSVVQI
tara:strand:+ start:164 stop:580 length:417 start_codon:yes stop_codon:yes gene_type:complete